ncbi:MAG: hypothetical protein L0211_15125 [Planctomycetaceae bacterium]|nr:hypothetical protein [Planctomycetaceae bacterium]
MSATFSLTNPLPAPALSHPRVDGVQVFEGDAVATEIEALGLPEYIHRPQPLYAAFVKCRYVLALLLLAATGGTLAFLYEQIRMEGQLGQLNDPWVMGGMGLVGAIVLAGAVCLTRISGAKASVFFYDEAALVVEGKKKTLIPWTQLLWHSGRIWTEGGQQFRCAWMEDHDRFEERIWAKTSEHWVPAQLAKIRAGQTVTCGELSLSATHVGCEGKTASWDDVTKLVIDINNYFHSLTIFTSHSSWTSWAFADLRTMPNRRGMEELIAQVCPSHLLVPVD